MSNRTDFYNSQPIYRCFHCKQDMVGDAAAAAHFGAEISGKPQCFTYPMNLQAILKQNAELRWFAEQIFNGIDAHMLDVSSPADDILENVMQRGRRAIEQPPLSVR